MTTFVEQNCTIEHDGRTFESGGAWICDCSDGFRRGVVYADVGNRRVTDWHGNTIAGAEYGVVYRGNFCKMQSVTFIVDGVKFHGRYCPDWSQAIRVKSTKRVSS